jgi:hypothetical protein
MRVSHFARRFQQRGIRNFPLWLAKGADRRKSGPGNGPGQFKGANVSRALFLNAGVGIFERKSIWVCIELGGANQMAAMDICN